MISKCSTLVRTAVVNAIVVLLSLTNPAPASGVTTIYVFQGGADGAEPVGSLITDKDGNLYGVTEQGGTNLGKEAVGPGTIFKIAPDGSKSILTYLGRRGAGKDPLNGLLRDRHGNLYGTTSAGGRGYASGAVYEFTHNGKLRTLHTLEYPVCESSSNLIADGAGNLYGTTENDLGAIFKLAPDGTFTTLHTFQGGNDGAGPDAGLIIDAAGNLYGTTQNGGAACNGAGCGTVFKVAPDGTETVVYAFAGGSNDGAIPFASVVEDSAGTLYGTTYEGGGSGCNGAGCGTVFKITADGVESVVHSFKAGTDGALPRAGLIIDKAGTLYGTTNAGGGSGCGGLGCGTVFKIAADGSETILHAFSGGSDGGGPLGGLLAASDGYLYGTTVGGGGGPGCEGYGCGTVFRIKR